MPRHRASRDLPLQQRPSCYRQPSSVAAAHLWFATIELQPTRALSTIARWLPFDLEILCLQLPRESCEEVGQLQAHLRSWASGAFIPRKPAHKRQREQQNLTQQKLASLYPPSLQLAFGSLRRPRLPLQPTFRALTDHISEQHGCPRQLCTPSDRSLPVRQRLCTSGRCVSYTDAVLCRSCK